MKVINIGLFKSKEEVEQFKKEENVLYSKKYEFFLVSDNVYNKLDKKYSLSEDDETYHYNNFTDFINNHSDIFVDFFENTYYGVDCVEELMEIINDEVDEGNNHFGFIDSEDWLIAIDEVLKSIMITLLEVDLREELQKVTEQGYDISFSYKSE